MNKSTRSIDKADRRSLTQCFIKCDRSRSKSPRHLDRSRISYFKQKDSWRSTNSSMVVTTRSKPSASRARLPAHLLDLQEEKFNSEKTVSKSPQTNRSGNQVLQGIHEHQIGKEQEHNKRMVREIDNLQQENNRLQSQLHQYKALFEQKHRDFIESQNQNKIIYQLQQDTKQENEVLQEFNKNLQAQNRKLSEELRMANCHYSQQSTQFSHFIEQDMQRYLNMLTRQDGRAQPMPFTEQQLSAIKEKPSSNRQSPVKRPSPPWRSPQESQKSSFQKQIENISLERSANLKSIHMSQPSLNSSCMLFTKEDHPTEHDQALHHAPFFQNDKTVRHSQEVSNQKSSVSLRHYLQQRKENNINNQRSLSKQSPNASMLSRHSDLSIMDKHEDQYQTKIFKQIRQNQLIKRDRLRKEKQYDYLYSKASSRHSSISRLSKCHSAVKSQGSIVRQRSRQPSREKSAKSRQSISKKDSDESSFSFQNKSSAELKPLHLGPQKSLKSFSSIRSDK